MKAAVHIHVFYPEFLDELLFCASNVTIPYDLFVTASVVLDAETVRKIERFKPGTIIEILENRGYDIGPFIYALNKMELHKYDYVIKLHYKRDMPFGSQINYFYAGGSKWRKYLLDFCSSEDKFAKAIAIFTAEPRVGMVSDGRLITSIDDQENAEVAHTAESIMNTIGLQAHEKIFVAGTAFIVRARLLRILQGKVQFEDFPMITQAREQSTLAHVYERLFGYIVYAQGEIIEALAGKAEDYNKYYWLRKICYNAVKFIFQIKKTRRGKIIVKIFKIPVFVKKANP